MHSIWIAVVLLLASVILLALAMQAVGNFRTELRRSILVWLLASVGLHLVAITAWALANWLLPYHGTVLEGQVSFFLALGLFAWVVFFTLGHRKFLVATGRWLVFGLAVTADGLVLGLVVDWYLLETMTSEVQTAACPTLRGFHDSQTCPNCGGEFVIPLFLRRDTTGRLAHDERFRKQGVCDNIVYPGPVAELTGEARSPDHFVVNHSRAPERWKLVVFRGSRTDRVCVIGRLVGLPGETIFIRDGMIWINGNALPVLEGLPQFRYSEDVPRRTLELSRSPRQKAFAHPDEPLKLGDSEYFVVADNPNSPLDSRVHGPSEQVDYLGTVDLIYWPINRFRFVP